jgi:hypothetical protein
MEPRPAVVATLDMERLIVNDSALSVPARSARPLMALCSSSDATFLSANVGHAHRAVYDDLLKSGRAAG